MMSLSIGLNFLSSILGEYLENAGSERLKQPAGSIPLGRETLVWERAEGSHEIAR